MRRTFGRAVAAGAALVLAGCVAPDDSGAEATPAVIEWASGGSFSGQAGARLYADETYERWQEGPFGAAPARSRKVLKPGTFAAALDFLRENPVPADTRDRRPACEDYGSDSLRYAGPGPDIAYVAACPENPVLPRIQRLEEVVSAAQR